jgi:hypothetical protein
VASVDFPHLTRMTLIYILVPTRSGNSSNTTLKIKFWFF